MGYGDVGCYGHPTILTPSKHRGKREETSVKQMLHYFPREYVSMFNVYGFTMYTN